MYEVPYRYFIYLTTWCDQVFRELFGVMHQSSLTAIGPLVKEMYQFNLPRDLASGQMVLWFYASKLLNICNKPPC